MLCSRALLSSVFGVTLAGLVLTSAPPATAALYSPQQAIPSEAIQQFLSNPAALLAQYPNGGAPMIARVRDLAASDPQTLNALIGLLATANPDQASATGTALGQVAMLAVNSDQAYAEQIQTAVAASGNSSALAAFSAVVGGNIKLAATGSGGGGGGGGGEEPTGAGNPSGISGGSGSINLSTFPNPAENFPTLSLSGASPGTQSSSVSASSP